MSLLNRENGILILGLPIDLKEDALWEICQFIPPRKILNREPGRHGLKIFFTEYDPVRKALSKRFLRIKGHNYPINLLITPLTIHSIHSHMDELKLRNLIEAWNFGIWRVYPETRPVSNEFEPTGNYRVLMLISDAENVPFPKFLKDPSLNLKFRVTLYCRRCMKNGHGQYECLEQGDIPTLGETSNCNYEELRKILNKENLTSEAEVINHIESIPNTDNELNSNVQRNVPCFWTGAHNGEDWAAATPKEQISVMKEQAACSLPSTCQSWNYTGIQDMNISIQKELATTKEDTSNNLCHIKVENSEDAPYNSNTEENSSGSLYKQSFKTNDECFETSFSNFCANGKKVNEEESSYILNHNNVQKRLPESTENSPRASFDTELLNHVDDSKKCNKNYARDMAEYNEKSFYSNNKKGNSFKRSISWASNTTICDGTSDSYTTQPYSLSAVSGLRKNSDSYRAEYSTFQSSARMASSERDVSSHRTSSHSQISDKKHFHDPSTTQSTSNPSQISDERRFRDFNIAQSTSNHSQISDRIRFHDPHKTQSTSNHSKISDRRRFRDSHTAQSASNHSRISDRRRYRNLHTTQLTSNHSQISDRRHSHEPSAKQLTSISHSQISDGRHCHDSCTLTSLNPDQDSQSLHNQQIFCWSSSLNSKFDDNSKQQCSSVLSGKLFKESTRRSGTSLRRKSYDAQMTTATMINFEDSKELKFEDSDQSDNGSNPEYEIESQHFQKNKTENKLNLVDLLPLRLKDKVKDIKVTIQKIIDVDKGIISELPFAESKEVEAVIIYNKKNIKLVSHQRRFLENLKLCLEKLKSSGKITKANCQLPSLSNYKIRKRNFTNPLNNSSNDDLSKIDSHNRLKLTENNETDISTQEQHHNQKQISLISKTPTRKLEETSTGSLSNQAQCRDFSCGSQLRPSKIFPQNNDILKQSSSSKHKTKTKIGISRNLTPGLWAANIKTTDIMDSSKYELFLTHVRNRKHPGKVAYKYAKDLDQIIEKVQAVLDSYYNRKLIGKNDRSEVRVQEDLIERLKSHKKEKCKFCLNPMPRKN